MQAAGINWDDELGQQKPGIDWDKELTPIKPTKEALESHTGEEALNYGFTPRNITHNVATGIGELAGGAGAIAADLGKNKNWIFGDKMHPSTLEKYILPGMEEESKKAAETSGMESFGHAVASGIPLIGPWAAGLGEQATHGDVGGALTKGATQSIGPKLFSDAAKVSTDIPAATVTAAGKGLSAVGKGLKTAAPLVHSITSKVADTVNPDLVGIVSPRAANVLRTAGKVAKATEKYAKGTAPTGPEEIPFAPATPVSRLALPRGPIIRPEPEPVEETMLREPKTQIVRGKGGRMTKQFLTGEAEPGEKAVLPGQQEPAFTGPGAEVSKPLIDTSAFENAAKPTFTTEGGAGQNYSPEDLAALKASLASRYGAAEPGPLAGEEKPLVDTAPLTKGEESGKISDMAKPLPPYVDKSSPLIKRVSGNQPITMFHGTAESRLADIAKEGLRTGRFLDEEELEGLTPEERKEYDVGLWLTASPEEAASYADRALILKNDEGNPAILKTTIPRGKLRVGRESAFGLENTGYDATVRGDETIPPEKLIRYFPETPEDRAETALIQSGAREDLERQGEASESINNKLFYRGNKPGYNPLIAGEGLKETPNKAPWGGLFSPEKGRAFEPGVGPGAMKGEPPKLVEVPTEGMWPKPRTGFIGKVTKVIPSEEEGMELVSFTKPDGESGIINLPEGTVNEGDELRPRGAAPAKIGAASAKTSEVNMKATVGGNLDEDETLTPDGKVIDLNEAGDFIFDGPKAASIAEIADHFNVSERDAKHILQKTTEYEERPFTKPGPRALPKPQDAKKLINTGVDRDVENAVDPRIPKLARELLYSYTNPEFKGIEGWSEQKLQTEFPGMPPQDVKSLRNEIQKLAGKKNLVEMPSTPGKKYVEDWVDRGKEKPDFSAVDDIARKMEKKQVDKVWKIFASYMDNLTDGKSTDGDVEKLKSLTGIERELGQSLIEAHMPAESKRAEVTKLTPKGTEPGDIRVPLDQVGFKKSDIPGFTQVGVVEPKTNSIHVYEVPNEAVEAFKKQGYLTVKGGFGNEDHVIKPGEKPPKKPKK